VGRLRDGGIWVEHCDDGECARPLGPGAPTPQVAAALAAYVLRGAPASR
jgi:hypothetical protein